MARLNYVKSFRGTSKTADGNLTCGSCREPIRKGDGYRWWANRLPGSRSGTKNNRCMKPGCTPKASEMTPGRAGELLAIQESVEEQVQALEGCTDTGDLESIVSEAADEIRGIAEGLTESADNMEDGFGHATSASDELRERADSVESQADDLENIDFDDPPEEGDEEYDREKTCPECDGEGEVDVIVLEEEDATHRITTITPAKTCPKCGGSGGVQDEEATAEAYQEALSEWISEQGDKVIEAVNEVDLY